MQEYLQQELTSNGVNMRKQYWLQSPSVLSEIEHTLIPETHEGKINSYGAIFAEHIEDLEDVEVMPLESDDLPLARKLADGEQTFLIYDKNRFAGLVNFKSYITTEIQLIRSFPISGGLMFHRSSAGITKFFQGDSLTIHDNRRWFTKPNVKTAAWKVSQCVADIDKGILNRILEFAFHFMSPTDRVGATLVWCLKHDCADPILDAAQPEDLRDLDLSLSNDSHTKMICHLLSHVDGATFLDPDGKLLCTGVQLKYTELSRSLIPEFKGTRHTSSVRFSYDFDDALVVTISEDGPVTVFSNGANIADLQIYSAHKKARLLREEIPEKRENIKSNSFTVDCRICSKQSMIEQVLIEGLNKPHALFCPVCKSPIYSAVCYSLEGRPFKQIKYRF